MNRLLGLLLMLLPLSARSADPWAAVKEARDQGLPRSALEALRPVEEAARRDRNWPQLARAIGERVVLESEIEGGRPEERVRRLAAELPAAPAELKPLFHTLLAHWYWQHFQQNRWRFAQRTATAGDAGDDFTTWDLPRLFAEMDHQFSAALADASALQRTPITAFDGLLEKGALPDALRPTLYDFIAREALAFYEAGEQAGARPQDAFVLAADSPIFADVPEFLAWQPVTTDTNAVLLRAVRLHQELLRFHAADADPAARLDADLARLRFGWNQAAGREKQSRYEAALRRFAERHAGHELSALARHVLAEQLFNRDDRAEAHAVATAAMRAFPDSPGGKLGRNLIRQIEAPEARVFAERVWNAPLAPIELHYRNVPRVWFRVVRDSWDKYLDRRQPRPEHLRDEDRTALRRATPAAAWSRDLPATPDFKPRLEELPPPADLAPGFYFLIASFREDFAEADNQLLFAPFFVSDLALVTRPVDGRIEGFVLDARTGEPREGAVVEGWWLNQQGARVRLPEARTDALGFFRLPPAPEHRPVLLRARHGGHEVATPGDLWAGRDSPERDARSFTRFFTDRALYRPGQLVQYKGVCLRVPPDAARAALIAGARVVVVFRDPNGQEIARATHQANDFGSFAGSFTAPADRGTGGMTIQVVEGPDGAVGVQVEEYKRPKFHVTLDAPANAPRLGEKATVTGRALAYTGAAVDGAKVTWRVVREVRFPPWWGWFRSGWPPQGEAQEIAHGEARTGVDGAFQIEFPALPDPAADPKDEPVFAFQVHADVTDSAGETRSGDRTVNAGFVAVRATLEADDWQQTDRPVAVRVRTASLDDVPQAAEGVLRVHRLKEPPAVVRPRAGEVSHYRPGSRDPRPDLSDPNHWEPGEVAVEQTFKTDGASVTMNTFTLPRGLYRIVLEMRDRAGQLATARLPLRVLDPAAGTLGLKVPQVLAAERWRVEPGAEFTALWGTGYEAGRAFIEIERDGRMLARFWTEPGRTQQLLRHAVTEELRGGFTLHVTQVRENRALFETRRIEVPWSNKELDLAWETFRSRLEPGQKEQWTLVIRGRDGTNRPPAAAEMVAALYDASLDQFLKHGWLEKFDFWPTARALPWPALAAGGGWLVGPNRWPLFLEGVPLTYRRFPPGWAWPVHRVYALPASALAGRGGVLREEALALGSVAERADAAAFAANTPEDRATRKRTGEPSAPDPAGVTARKNLQETAFFLPQLVSDSNGVVRLTFTMPEALTEWRFLGFAHDRQLRSGFLEGRTVTAKELMVQPNPPRFLREGDEVEFTVKVSNQSAARQTGRVRLAFSFAQDGAPADAALGNAAPERDFDIPAKESRSFGWRIKVPDGCGFLIFKATGTTGRLGDGEEGYLPVLSRRVFLTESLPLPVRGPGERRFTFTSLKDAAASPSVRHESFTVQMVSNPAWYAVLALPYLMEFPHECSEQTFNRLYANLLARHVANSDPRIRAVFDQWRATPALDSPLERNPELKNIALQETPWLRAAKDEAQARRQVAVLFEGNRLDAEIAAAQRKLAEMHQENGWPWFPGGPRNDYLTLYIVTGFGRLRHLGAEADLGLALGALPGLDAAQAERHARLKQDGHLDRNNLDPHTALYLYGRSFYLRDRPVDAAHREAFAYWQAQARRHWLTLPRLSQGHVALALKRLGDAATPAAILKSLKERSVTDDEFGRFWRDEEPAWSWHRAPIETHALMIEAFDEVAGDAAAVEELKVWLLKQKQTQNWRTTKATADAVYALLLRGPNLLASTRLVEVSAGGRSFAPAPASRHTPPSTPPSPPEAGTGFYQIRLPAAEVTPQLADLVVKKADAGVAWGAAHWQYFEDLERVQPFAGTPLTLTKTLFTRVNTKAGPVLQPVTGAVQVGDEIIVRLEIRTDRDLEFVHLKDGRGSGTEPVNVLTQFKWQDGLGYFESTRDTASHFFIEYLPKGTYVFEYPVRVQLRGAYPAGFAEILCMYAPEFNARSASPRLVVN